MKIITVLLALVLTTTFGYSQKEKNLKLNKVTNLIEATYFYENGQVSQMGTFNLAGKLEGNWTSFNETGQKTSVGSYENGLKTGKWLFWDNDKTLREVVFDNNDIASVANTKNSSGIVIKN
ncbi:MORN repeat variant [Pricia antarctica]|uniref:MORN repeat variant n=1 Tax=Pricia antarctica TaxID=641691 RepID=A0A1G6W0W5_9FLAO|nr:hypothetical protein [Pricia antarctica]SDD59459.1 MORN repeat variant [Pricia antarctica]